VIVNHQNAKGIHRKPPPERKLSGLIPNSLSRIAQGLPDMCKNNPLEMFWTFRVQRDQRGVDILIVQNYVEQRAVDLQSAVVMDEA